MFLSGDRSYILAEGDSLWSYFLSKHSSDFVLTEEELWSLLGQMTTALLTLKQHGLAHHHLKEYAVRRVSEHSFRLIYHPLMNSVRRFVDKGIYHWYNFYLPPESLQSLEVTQPDSTVFSLGAMALNLMNPLDCKRDIYSSQALELNPDIIEEKLRNTERVYSEVLGDIVRSMLQA